MIAIDGISPGREETPATPEELSRVMKDAFNGGLSVIPVGGGTKLHLGNSPRSAELAIRTSRLTGIVEYEPDNMTVSVLCGTTLLELQMVLKASNQFLPLDPPHASRATLGGIVACNSSGPIRFRYGTIRDMLIGVKIVHADGTPTKAGGKLVKNVTGYDMCKLYTGSLGTLGILSELTFKVQPRTDSMATVFLAYPSITLALEATQLFMKSDLLPDAMEAWNREALLPLSDFSGSTQSPWVLMIRFGEVEPAVQWQLERLKEIAPGSGGEVVNVLSMEQSEQFWEKASSAREAADAREETLVKCSVLYRSVPETARQLLDTGARLGAHTMLYCHAGTFVLYARYLWETGRKRNSGELREAFRALRSFCQAEGGHAVVEKTSPEVKNGFDIWGYDGSALQIMRRIKEEFDPKGLLNPGRFVGGI